MTTRTETKKQLETMRDDLTQLRDEIRVKLHLASMDLRDELEELEPRIDAFERRAEKATEAAGEELRESWAHLRKALERVRDQMSSRAV